MSDILYDVERAYKAMTKLWEESQELKKPMSYQRFKVLSTVCLGTIIVPDIAKAAGLDRSTTSDLLHKMRDDKLVTRERIDSRSYKWEATKKGMETYEKMSVLLGQMIEPFREIAKANLETWM